MSSFLASRLHLRKMALCLFLAMASICMPLSAHAYAAQQEETAREADTLSQPVVFIGFTGVRWEDINETDTPNLFAFTREAEGANLVVKTFGETTCPTRGWFTVGSGVRMSGTCAHVSVNDGKVTQWDSYVSTNATNPYKPRFGFLGQSLKNSVGSEKILVLGSGAGLALADSEGTVVGRYIDTTRVGDTSADNAGRVSVSDGLTHIDATTRFLFVDLGQVRYGNNSGAEASYEGLKSAAAAFAPQEVALPDKARADLSAIDDALGQVLKQVDVDMPQARVMVASLADSQASRTELSFFASRGLSDGPTNAFVSSESTRHEGLIQTVDITATLTSWFTPNSLQAQYLAGSPIEPGDQTDSLSSSLVSDQNRARITRVLVGPFYCAFLGLTVLVTLIAWRALRRSSQSTSTESRKNRHLAFTALAVASLPVSSLLVNLIPWWNTSHPRLAFVTIVVVLALLIAAIASTLAVRGKPVFSLAIVSCLTALVLIADVLADSAIACSLQFPSVLGSQPQVGGRFYGLSNATFAIFAAGLLIGLAVFVSLLVAQGKKTQAVILIVICGIIALTVDGLAVLGADFGGPPALTVGLGLLVLIVMDKKITIPRTLVVLVAALGVSLFFALLDYANPAEQRSHLGRFIQSVKDGNLLSVLSRKISGATFGLPIPLVVIVLLACLVLAVWLWKKYTPLQGLCARLAPSPHAGDTRADADALAVVRYSLPTVVVALVSAALINDSSITIPIVGGAMALMLYTSAFLRTR